MVVGVAVAPKRDVEEGAELEEKEKGAGEGVVEAVDVTPNPVNGCEVPNGVDVGVADGAPYPNIDVLAGVLPIRDGVVVGAVVPKGDVKLDVAWLVVAPNREGVVAGAEAPNAGVVVVAPNGVDVKEGVVVPNSCPVAAGAADAPNPPKGDWVVLTPKGVLVAVENGCVVAGVPNGLAAGVAPKGEGVVVEPFLPNW
jgi:hypothetical protein